jgi:hypothetical protein
MLSLQKSYVNVSSLIFKKYLLLSSILLEKFLNNLMHFKKVKLDPDRFTKSQPSGKENWEVFKNTHCLKKSQVY